MKECDVDADRLRPPCPQEQIEFARATFHRFQNHLQGLLGLLAMRRRQASPPDAIEIIDALGGQIAAMASVYRVKADSDTLRVGLQELTAAIVRGVSGALPVVLEASEDSIPVYLEENESVNIALALHVLLRHTAAHARGTLSMRLDREGDTVTLSLAGGGPAVSPGAEPVAGSTPARGIPLVESLLPPAGVDLAMNGGDGTVFRLTLSPPVIALDRGPS